MSISLAEDIRSVTDLKRHTREILDHIHQTGRPVVLTVNGRADSVIIDAKVYEVDLKGAFSAGVGAYLQKLGTGGTGPTAGIGRSLIGTSTSAGLGLSAGILVGRSRELLGVLRVVRH